jgi:hypothetical protein
MKLVKTNPNLETLKDFVNNFDLLNGWYLEFNDGAYIKKEQIYYEYFVSINVNRLFGERIIDCISKNCNPVYVDSDYIDFIVDIRSEGCVQNAMEEIQLADLILKNNLTQC